MLELVKQEKYTSQKSKSNLNISQKIFPYFTNTRSQDFSQTFYTYEIIGPSQTCQFYILKTLLNMIFYVINRPQLKWSLLISSGQINRFRLRYTLLSLLQLINMFILIESTESRFEAVRVPVT